MLETHFKVWVMLCYCVVCKFIGIYFTVSMEGTIDLHLKLVESTEVLAVLYFDGHSHSDI